MLGRKQSKYATPTSLSLSHEEQSRANLIFFSFFFSKALLEHNAKVYMASRTKSRAEGAIQELKVSTGKEAIFLELDLASLASVRRAAEEFLR